MDLVLHKKKQHCSDEAWEDGLQYTVSGGGEKRDEYTRVEPQVYLQLLPTTRITPHLYTSYFPVLSPDIKPPLPLQSDERALASGVHSTVFLLRDQIKSCSVCCSHTGLFGCESALIMQEVENYRTHDSESKH